jgi:cyclopropane-fatty-acyl-phospholipid synthase
MKAKRLLTTTSTRPIWAWLARRVQIGKVRLELPAGAPIHGEGTRAGPDATITIIRPGRMLWRIARGGGLGFAEAYMAGDWATGDLAATLEMAGRNLDIYVRSHRPSRLIEPIRRLWHRVTGRQRGEIESIGTHYNLGNDFYEAWLDRTMTYSSAVFTDDHTSLEAAQIEKYRRLAAVADLQPGDHVLEIGCGWGGFAEYAAGEIGCRVTGLTLSSEMAEYARGRLRRAGLDDRTEIKLQDFRDETGSYDKVVSIEMIESIPADLWPSLFATIRRTLRPGGRAAMQAITIAEDLYGSLLRRKDFISKHIFPNGSLPSVKKLDALARAHQLRTSQLSGYGSSYATTLRIWRDQFEAVWPGLSTGRFDERFRRAWEYYLAYCEAGFRIGRIDVHQVGFATS